jgi:hypothetical protein
MKTIQQIKSHLLTVGYNRDARHRILGFLLGNGTVKKGEVVRFTECKAGEKINDFNHFYAWFNSPERPEVDLLDYLADEQVEAIAKGDLSKALRISVIADFVIDHFGFDKKEKEKDINAKNNKNVK